MVVWRCRFLSLLIIRSRNLAWVGEISKVNLMVGWNRLARRVNSCREWRSPFQMKNMSSINLFQRRIWWENGGVRVVSIWDINKLAYGGAILVPMAVPWIWR